MWQMTYAKSLTLEKQRFELLYKKAILHYKTDNSWQEKLLYINPPPMISFLKENDCLDSSRSFFTYWYFLKPNLEYYWEYLSD